MTRLDVVNQILGLLRRSDCSQALALTFLGQGMSRIERQLRVPSMERVATGTATGTPMQSCPIPSDLLEIKDVVANGLPLDKLAPRMLQTKLFAATLGGVASAVNYASQPVYYARSGSSLLLWPYLPVGQGVTLTYYGSLGDLSTDASTNEATTAFPDLLTYASLAFAGRYFRHDETENWEQMFGTLLSETQDLADQLDATGGSEAVQSAYGEC